MVSWRHGIAWDFEERLFDGSRWKSVRDVITRVLWKYFFTNALCGTKHFTGEES